MASYMNEEEPIHYKEISEFYDELVSMFPNVEKNYIREICINPPFNVSEEEFLLNKLINHLLNYKDKNEESQDLPVKVEVMAITNISNEFLNDIIVEDDFQQTETILNDALLSEMLQVEYLESMEQERLNQEVINEQLLAEFLQNDEEVIDEKLKIMENILPDANPEILRDFIKRNQDNTASLNGFIESNILNKNYEKRDQYFSKLKNRENIQKYITNFNVEDFIKEFPEPFEYFENVERTSPYQEKVLHFLIARYKIYDAQYVKNAYISSKHNLSIADNFLHAPEKLCSQSNIEIEDTSLLQEIAFIQNKQVIRKHLEEIKQKEEKEMRLLKAQKLLLECQCCFDDLKPQECIECENNHVFCKKCVVKGTNLAISNSEAFVYCFSGCKKEISLNILQRVLPESAFDKLLRKRQEFEVAAAKLGNLITCPFCPYSEEIDPQIKIFCCKNPVCKKISCSLCKKPNHLPIKCEDVLDEQKGRLLVEEAMSQALIRNCHNCNKPFVKTDGCNVMTCRCGATMCYICRKPYTAGYFHNRCSVDSTTYIQNEIEHSRREATEKIQKDFPDVKVPNI